MACEGWAPRCLERARQPLAVVAIKRFEGSNLCGALQVRSISDNFVTMQVRSVIRRVGVSVGAIATAWALVVWMSGGFTVELLDVRVRSHNQLRPIIFAALGWLTYLAMGGRLPWPPAWDAARVRTAHHWIAAVVAVLTFVLGVAYATTSVGGSDSYGYASQADLWIDGRATIQQPWIAAVPWPAAAATFSPLGYRPSARPLAPGTLVPIYAPGLPWLMAAAKLVGGQETMFWVAPILGALLVLATYGIGCRLASPTAGLIAAWLVATSPATLFMLVVPMSDVPAAGAWAVAWYFLLGRTSWSAAGAGLASAVAIAIRPNLVFGAAIMGCWYAIRVWRHHGGGHGRALLHVTAFAVAVLPGIVAVALVNHALNGSPLRSGYGSMEGWFTADNVWPNVRLYAGWLVDSQTPLVLAGLGALAVPTRKLWPAAQDRAVLLAAGAFVVGIWVLYCFYWRFGDWWSLRLLLPTWPFMMAGVGAVVVALTRPASASIRTVVVIATLAYGAYELRQAATRLVFELWKYDRHYPAVGRLVGALTDTQTVILSRQHSGSLRYYGGRVTLRYDELDPQWLDRAVAWLGERGVRAYLLADAWEIVEIKKRFKGQRALEHLDRPPVVDYRGPTNVLLYDLSRPSDGPSRIVWESYANLRSVSPVPLAIPSFE